MDPLGWAFAAKWAFAPDFTVYVEAPLYSNISACPFKCVDMVCGRCIQVVSLSRYISIEIIPLGPDGSGLWGR